MANRLNRLGNKATESTERLLGTIDKLTDTGGLAVEWMHNWTRVGVIGSEVAVIVAESNKKVKILEAEMETEKWLRKTLKEREELGMSES